MKKQFVWNQCSRCHQCGHNVTTCVKILKEIGNSNGKNNAYKGPGLSTSTTSTSSDNNIQDLPHKQGIMGIERFLNTLSRIHKSDMAKQRNGHGRRGRRVNRGNDNKNSDTNNIETSDEFDSRMTRWLNYL